MEKGEHHQMVRRVSLGSLLFQAFQAEVEHSIPYISLYIRECRKYLKLSFKQILNMYIIIEGMVIKCKDDV